MKFSVVIPTRGDHNLAPILQSYEGIADEVLIWDNGAKKLWWNRPEGSFATVEDLSVYGRYAAIEYARNDLILTQDDDCVVSDPQAIVDALLFALKPNPPIELQPVVCNMPPEFRHDFYEDHALVGFGACFHRDAPFDAFQYNPAVYHLMENEPEFFRRTCDIVFTALTPRVLVDVPKTNLPWAEDDNRMYRQSTHVEERTRMLDLVRKVRDGSPA